MSTSTIIVLVVAVLFILFLIVTYNRFVQLKNYIKEAFSTMDVYMKKRWDLIPNLVESVKAYVSHERGLLEEITNLRNNTYSNLSNDKKMELNQQLGSGLSKLIAVAENYPDLKANQNFIALQEELAKIEDEIASSRRYYNGTVREYNTAIQMFPSNVLAGIFGFAPEKMFEIDEIERQNVKVQF